VLHFYLKALRLTELLTTIQDVILLFPFCR